MISLNSLGVGHDSVEKGCPNGVNIMSKVAQGGPGSVEWSTCSRDTIQNFLMYVVYRNRMMAVNLYDR